MDTHMKCVIAYWLVLNFPAQVITNQDTTRIFERCTLIQLNIQGLYLSLIFKCAESRAGFI